ncbi:MAG: hypothetical protein FJZ01_04960 [Candidatus Sericytochromatia bacterium]|nr:hypothetical protein [Candidatus Tanganyikabacteria bacterium]
MAKKTVTKGDAAIETRAAANPPALSVEVGPDMSVGPVAVDVQVGRIAVLVEPGEESQVLSFRGAEYHLPRSIVSHPLPTLTFRHLQKVTEYAFMGKREKVASAVKRAIASAIDTASLVKIGCVAHSEGLHVDATVALAKAVRCAKKDQRLKGIANNVASRLGYHLGG